MLGLTPPKNAWEPPSLLWSFLANPVAWVARTTYGLFVYVRGHPRPGQRAVRVVCISDTHCLKKPIPEGDLLIHAGDLTDAGTTEEIQDQIDWLHSLPHTHKVVIAGNHDTFLDPRSRRTLGPTEQSKTLDWKSLRYLQHSETVVGFPDHGNRRLKIYGAPQIPACGGPEMAFQYTRHQDGWTETIPRGIDVLITHTPPRWHLDQPAGLGCEWLLKEIWSVRPKLHVFGHIHAQPGVQSVWFDEGQAAYERICERSSKTLWGIVSPLTWLDFMILVTSGVKNVAWTTLWGGQPTRGGFLVNAAQIVDATKQLDNEPKIVFI